MKAAYIGVLLHQALILLLLLLQLELLCSSPQQRLSIRNSFEPLDDWPNTKANQSLQQREGLAQP